ncbi:helix-turn-helix domain-containing protein [Halostreptopolyspora alba]|uniref:XRE family transcriptional regulator n=1 Tax=Halostreptopolyspora alba TaxID=2487137 RepID=A0A3N0EC16_9ACTN|nr:XRE family transcriptional regulator [Nocardiopsaceae bacterium YIM 96095]
MGSPTVGRWQLAHELRRLRGDETRDSAAKAIGVAPSSITRWEDPAGMTPRARDLKLLLGHYGVGEDETTRVLNLRSQARTPGWWQEYGIAKEYGTYIGLEAEATRIENYESALVPGLLQTEDYTRAVVQAAVPGISEEELASQVHVRTVRQDRWREQLPETWFFINEAVIHQQVGGPYVMTEQLKRLLALPGNGSVTLQLLPYEAGAHAGLPQPPFSLLHLREVAAVCTESYNGTLLLDKPSDIDRHVRLLNHLRAAAASPQQTRITIERALRTLEGLSK